MTRYCRKCGIDYEPIGEPEEHERRGFCTSYCFDARMGDLTPRVSNKHQHGTTSNYRVGCRCAECTAAASEASRKRYVSHPKAAPMRDLLAEAGITQRQYEALVVVGLLPRRGHDKSAPLPTVEALLAARAAYIERKGDAAEARRRNLAIGRAKRWAHKQEAAA